MYRTKCQTVGEKHPKQENGDQCYAQQSNLGRCNRENITDQVTVILGKAVTAQRGSKDADRNGSAGKNADQGICCMVAAAADKGKQKCLTKYREE